MTIFYNIETKEFPRYQGDLELFGWKEGEEIPNPWVEVAPVPFPELEKNQYISNTGVEKIDEIWTVFYTVASRTPEEQTLFEEKLKTLNEIHDLRFVVPEEE